MSPDTPALRARWVPDRYLLAILLLATVNFSISIGWGLPQGVSPETVSPWPIDTIAPVQPLTEAYHRFTRDNSEWVVYPLFHYIVLDIAYAPYVAFQYLAGNLQNPSGTFPYGAVKPGSFFRDLTLVARLVSLFMALGIVITVHAITREVFSRQAARWSALIAALLAPLAYYATTSNLDTPYLFWLLLAVWQFIIAIKRQRLGNYIGFGVFAALAIATKDQAYGFFIATPLIMIYALARHRSGDRVSPGNLCAATIGKPILLTGVATVVAFALANNLVLGGFDGFVRHLDFARTLFASRLETSEVDLHSAAWQFGLLADTAKLLGNMLGPLTLLVCVAGLVSTIAQRNWLALSLFALILTYYVATLAAAGLVLTRYLLGPALLLCPFGGALIASAFTRERLTRAATGVIITCAFGWQALLCINLNVSLTGDSRYNLEAWIRANIAPGATIESQIQPRYLPHVSDAHNFSIVGNAFDAIDYSLRSEELSAKALHQRNPDYVLILRGVGVTGDPDRNDHPGLQQYYDDLLGGRMGYSILARFDTPRFLPIRQITAGIQPRAILLGRSGS